MPRKGDAYTDIDSQAIEEEKKTTDRLVEWLQANNCSLPYLYFQYYAVDFRGIHVSEDIKNGVCILEVSPECLITTEKARQSDIGMKINRSGCRLRSTHTYVASYILQERLKGPKSFWKPYIDMFPKSYRHMPMMFDDDELRYLQGSLCTSELQKRKHNYVEEYNNICNHLPEYRTFSLDDFIWARLVVLTRIFGITYQGRKTSAMVPMADMLNHKRPPETYWSFDSKVDAFTITATKELKKGQQVYDSYGCKCNTVFFMNYGFVAEKNKWDESIFTVALPDGDPLRPRKVNIVAGFAARGWKELCIPTNYEVAATQEAFSFLRIAVATEGELNRVCGGEFYRPNCRKVEAINLRNEREVLKAISICAKARLAQFDSTIQEDQKLIDENKFSRNIMNCIKTRQCEKKVMQYYVDLERLVLGCLDVKNSVEQARELLSADTDIQGNSHMRTYVKKIIMPLLESNREDSIGYLVQQFTHMQVQAVF